MDKHTLKPGDLIEWVYKYNNKVVRTYECLFSSTMHDWVPIGAPALLVMVTEETYAWLTPKGLFHARVGDITDGAEDCVACEVVSRRVNL